MNQRVSKILVVALNFISVLFIVFIAYAATNYIKATPTFANNPSRKSESGPVFLAALLPNVQWAKATRTAVLVLRSDCHYCQQSLPLHRKILSWSQQHPRSLQVIAVFSEPKTQAEAALRLEKLDIRDIEIADMAPARVYGTPALLIADQTGRVVERYDGAVSTDKQPQVLAALGIYKNGQQGDLADATLDPTGPSPESVADGLANSLVDARATVAAAADASEVTFLDIRSREDFAKSHIAGAINIPHDELEARLPHEIDPAKPIFVYCTYYNKCEADFRSKGVLTGCTISLFMIKSAGYDGARLITEDLGKLESAGLPIWSNTSGIAKAR